MNTKYKKLIYAILALIILFFLFQGLNATFKYLSEINGRNMLATAGGSSNDYTDPEVKCSASETLIDINNTITYNATVSNGKSPYTYSWTGDYVKSVDSDEITAKYTKVGSFDVSVNVSDTRSNSGDADCGTVEVVPPVEWTVTKEFDSKDVSMDNDGPTKPPFKDESWQNDTSLGGLDAEDDNYVVTPEDSNIPLGTKVTVTNLTTGKSVKGVVADRGHSYSEISRAAARRIDLWKKGMGDEIITGHKISITYHLDQ